MQLRVVLIVLAFTTWSTAAAAVEVGTVAILHGTATVTRDRIVSPLHKGDAVENGDLVHSGGRLQILLKDESVLSLGPDSFLRIDVVQTISEPPTRHVGLDLLRGALRVLASHRSLRSRFDVTTQHLVTAVRGTEFGILVDSTLTKVMVFDGRVLICRKFFLRNATITLGPGDTVAASSNNLGIRRQWTDEDIADIPTIEDSTPAGAMANDIPLAPYNFSTCQDSGTAQRLHGFGFARGANSGDPPKGDDERISAPDPIPQ